MFALDRELMHIYGSVICKDSLPALGGHLYRLGRDKVQVHRLARTPQETIIVKSKQRSGTEAIRNQIQPSKPK